MPTDWPLGQPDTFREKVQSTDFKGAVSASGIAKQTPDQRAAIEAVMFALWASEQSERWGEKTVLLAISSRVADTIIDIFKLPVVLIRHLPGMALAVAVVLAASYAFDWSLPRQTQVGLFIVAALVLFKDDVLQWVRCFLFDIGDVFSNGALTRRYINRHFLYGPITVFEDADGLKLHLARSRSLTSGPYFAETGAFQEIVARQIDDWPSLRRAIDGFWKEFPTNPEYWRRLNELREKIEPETLEARDWVEGRLSRTSNDTYLAEGSQPAHEAKPSVADVHTSSFLPSMRTTGWIIACFLLLILSHAAQTGRSILQSSDDFVHEVTGGQWGALASSGANAPLIYQNEQEGTADAKVKGLKPGTRMVIGGRPATFKGFATESK